MATGWISPWQYWWNDQSKEYTWTLKFVFLPRKTENNKWAWLTKVYHGTRIVYGPGTPVILEKWMIPEEFTWFRLTNA
jgi:hypothetical protein